MAEGWSPRLTSRASSILRLHLQVFAPSEARILEGGHEPRLESSQPDN